jgi:hypothetical protein
MPVIRWLIPCARGPMSQGPSVSPNNILRPVTICHTICGLTELNEASSLAVQSGSDRERAKTPPPRHVPPVPFDCNSRSRAVAVCGASPSFPVSAFGLRTGVRSSASMASGSRDRLSPQ